MFVPKPQSSAVSTRQNVIQNNVAPIQLKHFVVYKKNYTCIISTSMHSWNKLQFGKTYIVLLFKTRKSNKTTASRGRRASNTLDTSLIISEAAVEDFVLNDS